APGPAPRATRPGRLRGRSRPTWALPPCTRKSRKADGSVRELRRPVTPKVRPAKMAVKGVPACRLWVKTILTIFQIARPVGADSVLRGIERNALLARIRKKGGMSEVTLKEFANK